jgi:hypothetical protein
LVTIVTVAQVTNAVLWFVLGPFREPQGLVTGRVAVFRATMLGMQHWSWRS